VLVCLLIAPTTAVFADDLPVPANEAGDGTAGGAPDVEAPDATIGEGSVNQSTPPTGSQEDAAAGDNADVSGASGGGASGDDADEGDADFDLSIQAAPYDTPVVKGQYRIRPAVSDTRMLDIYGGSKKAGANVQVFQSNNAANQFFDISSDKDGYYTIKNINSGLVLDVAGSRAKEGANVVQNAPSTAANNLSQKWVITQKLDTAGRPVYTVTSALPGNFMLDVYGGNDRDETNVQIWAAHGLASQQFYFVPFDAGVVPTDVGLSGFYTLTSALSSKSVVDIAGTSSANGVQLALWESHGGINQIFEIKRQPDGFYTIRPLCSGKYVDVTGSSVVATTPIIQFSKTDNDNQRWAIVNNGNGYYSFVAKQSGLVMGISGGSAANGAKLQLSYSHGGNNQKFKLTPAGSALLKQGVFGIVPFANMGQRVDIQGSSRSAGTNALVWASHSGLNQKFEVIPTGETATYAFRSLVSGLYLAATATNGTVTQQQGSSSGVPLATQKWIATYVFGGVRLTNSSTGQAMTVSSGTLKLAAPNTGSSTSQAFQFSAVNPIEPGCYQVKSITGLALDVSGNSLSAGANVTFWSSHNDENQKWNLTIGSDGYYTLAHPRSGKVLDVAGGGTAEGTNVLMWDKHNYAWQKWLPVPSGDGYFYLKSATGTWLSVAGNGDYNGANVFVSTTTSKRAQKFSFAPTTWSPYSGTYADVNLTTQKMFFVKNGNIVVQSDVVTGAPSMKTPTGTFRVLGKSSPATLVGPGYRQPVSYWMPFTPGGVGFHDANWQPWFGGNRWTYAGSHGCVNMPYANAQKLYSYLSVGDEVRVHY
jgi:hypothetical protein